MTSKLFDKKTMISGSKHLENVFIDFRDKEYIFSHIVEVNIITKANKLDMSYDFYFKHNICALKWKLNAVISKNKTLINEMNRN